MSKELNSDTKKTKGLIREDEQNRPFSRLNFIVMGVSVLLIVVGFLLMVGGGSNDPNVFSEDIFSSSRIVIGPLMAFLGFVGIAVGIIVKPRK